MFFADIDECGTGRHSCANDTICFNLDGGYDCRCPHGKNCTGDCIHEDKIKHNGQIWVLENDRCSVCSCQVSRNKTICYSKDFGRDEGKNIVIQVKFLFWLPFHLRMWCYTKMAFCRVLGWASLSNLYKQNFNMRLIIYSWQKGKSTTWLAEMPPMFSGWE